jgi:hypothetical protein
MEDKRNPSFLSQTRYFVPARIWQERVADEGHRGKWILAFRRIARATDERTAIFTILPQCVTGSQTPVAVVNQNPQLVAALQANFNSFVFDFATRQRVGGTDLNHFIIHQLPVMTPATYTQSCAWLPSGTLREWIAPRVLELTYTAHDLRGFAEDCGYAGEPFRWDEARRFLLRSELDAAYFHLYGIVRGDADYILDTFPIVRRKDEAQHGEYRTRRVILEIYDAMQQAITTGQPYQTRLDPPPANGWTPPEMEEDRETGGRGEEEKGSGSASPEFRLRREDARPQPGLFDKAE